MLVVLIAASLWVKNKYPESDAAKIIDNSYRQGLSLIEKLYALASEKVANTGNTGNDGGSLNSQQPTNQSHKVDASFDDVSELQVKSFDEPKVDEAVSLIPEDSVLRRHYLAQIEAEQKSITNPYPTDSVLRRHYESNLVSLVAPVSDAIESNVMPVISMQTKLNVPEDAVLRRHFLTELRSEIEATLFPRPTDSTLVRHYESHIHSEIAARLAEAA